MFESILLESKQKQLLHDLVNAHSNTANDQRTFFRYEPMLWTSGHFVSHPGLPNRQIEVFIGDLEALRNVQLISSIHGYGPSAFVITPKGIAYNEYLLNLMNVELINSVIEANTVKIAHANVAIEGNVNMGDGDFISRDKNITNNYFIESAQTVSLQPHRMNQTKSDYIIVNVASIIDYQFSQIEEILGVPSQIISIGIGAAEEIPDGGETREYCVGNYIINVNLDKFGVARGIQVVSGLIDNHYTLEHWAVALSKMGIMVTKEPDIVAPAARRWKDYLGYSINIFADKPNGAIWSVRIYKNIKM